MSSLLPLLSSNSATEETNPACSALYGRRQLAPFPPDACEPISAGDAIIFCGSSADASPRRLASFPPELMTQDRTECVSSQPPTLLSQLPLLSPLSPESGCPAARRSSDVSSLSWSSSLPETPQRFSLASFPPELFEGALDESNIDFLVLEDRPTTEVEAGAAYTGQWRGELRHGVGRLVKPDRGCFEGEFADGKAHGYGKYTSRDGNVYEGLWAADRAEGCGTYNHIEGDRYEGEWQNDQKHGAGVEVWSDGAIYDGEYVSGKKHGRGKYKSEGAVYDGQFRDDCMEGDGTYTFSDMRAYSGQWQASHMNGVGKMVFPSGACYEGGYANDTKNGEGIFNWSDGRTYSGQWFMGKQDGKGVSTDKSGIKICGVWENGKRSTHTTVAHIGSTQHTSFSII